MRKGFTLVEIMIVVAIIGLLAAIAIPSFMKARTTSQMNACINNLRQIESAKDQYAIEHGNPTNALTFANLVGTVSGYMKTNPACPASASALAKGLQTRAEADYTINGIGTNPACQVVAATHVLP